MHSRMLTVAAKLVKHEYHGQVWFTVEAMNGQQKRSVDVDGVQDHRTAVSAKQQEARR